MAETNENALTEDKADAAENVDQNDEVKLEDSWMIRDCDLYYDEYKECTSFRGRFQQYFVFGESLDCNQWNHDYNNCRKWEDKGDIMAGEAVVKSERIRRIERLRGHMQNDTWKKRTGPPPDWDKPLPEWMAKRDENTYLAEKAKEIREGTPIEETSSYCSIM